MPGWTIGGPGRAITRTSGTHATWSVGGCDTKSARCRVNRGDAPFQTCHLLIRGLRRGLHLGEIECRRNGIGLNPGRSAIGPSS